MHRNVCACNCGDSRSVIAVVCESTLFTGTDPPSLPPIHSSLITLPHRFPLSAQPSSLCRVVCPNEHPSSLFFLPRGESTGDITPYRPHSTLHEWARRRCGLWHDNMIECLIVIWWFLSQCHFWFGSCVFIWVAVKRTIMGLSQKCECEESAAQMELHMALINIFVKQHNQKNVIIYHELVLNILIVLCVWETVRLE